MTSRFVTIKENEIRGRLIYSRFLTRRVTRRTLVTHITHESCCWGGGKDKGYVYIGCMYVFVYVYVCVV